VLLGKLVIKEYAYSYDNNLIRRSDISLLYRTILPEIYLDNYVSNR